jgi:methylthioribose-1-phosphate isomerase
LEALRLHSQARAAFDAALDTGFAVLAQSRPTAVNLFWALDRMQRCRAQHSEESPSQLAAALLAEAKALHEEDIRINQKMGEHGAALLADGARVLTHCNAGALATAGHGTALGVFRSAVAAGKKISVIADETRPFLQGARLTAWEMVQENIPVTLITDNMAGHLMKQGDIDAVVVGTDRVAANGDVANKIGTYLKALAAKDNGVPFYVALPSSSFDWQLQDGVKDIEIEERNPDELKYMEGLCDGEIKKIALTPEGSPALNIGFDVTPARLITGLITERGICRADKESILQLFPEKQKHG